ncbi:MAG: hypothetical protein LBB26_01745 [Puniceicoccales bacterium]|nr:hypothetical protein [Puniceicoccales bacterium]
MIGVGTLAVVSAVVFFSPGAFVIFLSFAGMFGGGTLGVIMASCAGGGVIIGISGLGGGYCASRLFEALNGSTKTLTTANEQGPADAAPEPSPETHEGSPGAREEPQEAVNSQKPKKHATTTRPTKNLPFATDGTPGTPGDVRSNMLAGIKRGVSLKLVTRSENQQGATIEQKIADTHFGGKVPDAETDPLGYAEYRARASLFEANVKLRQAEADATLGPTQVAAAGAARQKRDEIQKQIDDLGVQKVLAAAVADMATDGKTLLEELEQLGRLEQLEAQVQDLQKAVEERKEIAADSQRLGVADVAGLTGAYKAMLGACMPQGGRASHMEDKFYADVDAVKKKIAILCDMARKISRERKLPGCPKTNELLTVLAGKPTLAELVKIGSNVVRTCRSESHKLPTETKDKLGELLSKLEELYTIIANLKIPTNEANKNLFALMLTAEDPRQFGAKLVSLNNRISSLPKNPQEPIDQLTELNTQIEMLREKIGGEGVIADLRNLLADVGCRSDLSDRQKIEEHLAAIEKRQKASTEPTVALRAEPQTDKGTWLVSAKTVDFNAIRIDGRDDDLSEEETRAFTEIVDLLVPLVERGPLPIARLPARLLALLKEYKAEDVDIRSVLARINAAIEARRDPATLVKAVFDNEQW